LLKAVLNLTETAMQPDTPKRILESLTSAVLTFDPGLRLTSINPAGEMLFEISAKKIVGHTLGELLPHSGQIAQVLQQTLDSRHPFTARGVRLLLPGRRRVTVDCTVTPLAEHGEALLVELMQVDRLMRLARDEGLLQRQAANRAVIRGLAHEIKNPLGGLRGAAQLLERELASNELKEYTRIIIHEADRLRTLVDRMTGPIQPLRQERVNIHDVLEHVARLILVEVPVGLTIERRYDPSLPELLGDRDQLIQAILNVVRNAVEAMENKGRVQLRTRIERSFTIRQKRHRLVLCVDVEDDGPGVPAELREQIFYPMVTSKPTGTGLGLSIAQDIISKHGGLIGCDSRPKQTIFTLHLPLEAYHGQA
jgi:two-component system, NtrC family, nitrogen regulation sensor histidine kinase GlnL